MGKNISQLHLIMIILMLFIFLIPACGVTVSPEKRKPLESMAFNSSLQTNVKKVIIRFEETLPEKPLNETVWDNVNGAFWDINESRQIGYTQNYKKLTSASAVGGVLGGAIGGAIVGLAAGPNLVDTRIVIPFGRIFEENFQAGLKQSFPNSVICPDKNCESQNIKDNNQAYILKVKIQSFQVWENPANHINFRSKIVSELYGNSNLEKPVKVFEANNEALNQPLGSILSTSSTFISKMNSMANTFAQEITVEILTHTVGS